MLCRSPGRYAVYYFAKNVQAASAAAVVGVSPFRARRNDFNWLGDDFKSHRQAAEQFAVNLDGGVARSAGARGA